MTHLTHLTHLAHLLGMTINSKNPHLMQLTHHTHHRLNTFNDTSNPPNTPRPFIRYDYQFEEWQFMNSSVMPDKVRPESAYPDYKFASSAIDELNYLTTKEKQQYFMLSIGFKMPHTAYHVPHKYYEMYRSRRDKFQATPEQLRFPRTSPMISWRCCADRNFQYMNNEGSAKANRSYMVQRVKDPFPLSVHQELAWGYAALITFVDQQLGRVLDAIDELKLWNNLTIILTADHGMHNGEKGNVNSRLWIELPYSDHILTHVTSIPSI